MYTNKHRNWMLQRQMHIYNEIKYLIHAQERWEIYTSLELELELDIIISTKNKQTIFIPSLCQPSPSARTARTPVHTHSTSSVLILWALYYTIGYVYRIERSINQPHGRWTHDALRVIIIIVSTLSASHFNEH